MSTLRKILEIIGFAAPFLVLAWWAITGLGVAEVIGQILWQSLTGWYTFSGLRRWYLLGGALTVLIVTLAYGIPAMLWTNELRSSHLINASLHAAMPAHAKFNDGTTFS
jgi:hypothetical protein